jgi:6-pyruvoyltetrahydropterin/6-carboxytetrahydropterin synthase
MFEVFVEGHFSAAHRLTDYPGNCARWHGHNWTVAVHVQAEQLNEMGLAVDFRQIKDALNGTLSKYDHVDLNQVPELAGINPSCEILAQRLFRELSTELNDGNLKVSRVRVSETPNTGVWYSE